MSGEGAPRLALKTLGDLPADVARPGYDVGAAEVGVVHLGVGAFHRAHQAVYLDDVMARGAKGWAIAGASLRAADTYDALAPQDGLYTLAVRSGAGDALRVVGSLRHLLVAPRDPQALLSAMCDPKVRIVSLTVTEKGYCHDPASGTLDEAHPDIRADLADPHRPRSAPGFLVEALARRRAAGTRPFTVLCCDNLPANGTTVARVTARLAALRDPDLGRFVEGEVAFPSTMVDRIVPATTDADRALVAQRLGVADAWPVMAEPFSQWVVEDRFPAGRPPLEEVGAQVVADVAPYEHMKLRLLNGAHSTLAYLGYLAGHETIADTMADAAFARLVQRLQDEEITPTLAVPPGADLAGYKAALRERFRNPALRHRTWQIAMDGSQKLPQRLVATARDRLAAGAPIDLIALGIAGWMRYVAGWDEHGRAIDVRDPLASRLRTLADAAGLDAPRLAPALLSVREVFGTDLPADPRFATAVTEALGDVIRGGAAGAVGRVVTR
ncbi:mannitol dehydrogenase family protein [Xanthobacter tagetidis]|uniref:Mannitol dehydrogenase family protein n=1 Tax=Xanthobacter tagetidis TaxID=60216 RepID=A0A3L7AHC3_9HYPH|nr:mannitol dehydrogenase family protein [Xanthobacter tagetidis]MBB6306318.1 fructuronate reductase [Xanthobacter tagetidis]RLP79587.1 mannitol dehydrogenase family protein [Xanthobacter tagetidis]